MRQLIAYILTGFILCAYSVPGIAHKNCKILDQSGSVDIFWCRKNNSSNSIRCYAEVEYQDGTKRKIWSRDKHCQSSYADCWSLGSERVEPYCAD